jgi:hypothetical protein
MLIDGFDGLFDRLVRRFRRSRREQPNHSFVNHNARRTGEFTFSVNDQCTEMGPDTDSLRSGQRPPGFFNNSQNVVVNQPIFTENFNNNNISGGTTGEQIGIQSQP